MTALSSATATDPALVFLVGARRPGLVAASCAIAARLADGLGAAAVGSCLTPAPAAGRSDPRGYVPTSAPVVVALLDADSALDLCLGGHGSAGHARATRELALALRRRAAGDCHVLPVLVGVRSVAVPDEFADLHCIAPAVLDLPDGVDAVVEAAQRAAVTAVVDRLEDCPTVGVAQALPDLARDRVAAALAARSRRSAAAARALLLLRALSPDTALPEPAGPPPAPTLPGLAELVVLGALRRGALDEAIADDAVLAAVRDVAADGAGVLGRRPLLAAVLALLVRQAREARPPALPRQAGAAGRRDAGTGEGAPLAELPSSSRLHRHFASCRVVGPGRAFHADRRQAHALLATLFGEVDAALLSALTGAAPWPARS